MLLRPAAELGYSPESPGEAARLLVDEGFLTEEEYELVRRVAGFRNVLVHSYARVDMGLVRRVIEQGEYRRVAGLASKLLSEAAERSLDP